MAFATGYDPMDDSIGTQNERTRTPLEFDEEEINADDLFLARSPLRDFSESPIADESPQIHMVKPAFVMPEGADIIDLDHWVPTSENGTTAETPETRIKEEPCEINVGDIVGTTRIIDAQVPPVIMVPVDENEIEVTEEGDGPRKFVCNDQTKELIIIPDDGLDIPRDPMVILADGNTLIPPMATPNKATLKQTLLTKKKTKQPFTALQNARMLEIQAELAERSTGKPVIGGAANIFKGQGIAPTAPVQRSSGVVRDLNAWMHGDVDEDEVDDDPTAKFAHLKKKYHAKKRAGTDKWEDEIEFIKAQRAEKARLKRIETELQRASGAGNSEGKDAEADDDGLFVSDKQAGAPSQKRTYFATVETEDEDEPPVRGENPPKRAKVRGKKRSEEMDLAEACMAGIDEEIAKNDKATKKKNGPGGKKGASKAASKRGPNARGDKSRKEKPATSKTAKKKDPKPKPTLFRDVGSLLSSNVYVDANANLDKREAPVMTEKRKDDALKQLVASVPLEDRRMASLEKQHILNATKVLGMRKVRPDGNGKWAFKGMKSALPHFQVQGAAWMVERETGDDEPFGGMLCDSMGFGKTVMLIALILANKPPAGEPCKTTLIIATPALVTQWEEELAKHAEPDAMGDVVRFHAGSRIVGSGVLSLLRQADIVLSTYGEIVKSYPKNVPPKELMSHESKMAWWKDHFETHRGPLHRLRFHRVILDEAQCIKNYKSQTSKACQGLLANHRWAVSGTPIQNSPRELFPYWKFLRVRHTGTYEVFCENFCDKSNGMGDERLHSFLRRFMIRRVYTDTLFGAPLVKLPENHERTIAIEFSPVERAIYEIIRARFIQRINTWQSRGVLEKSYNSVLVMLLRLRQMTAHTFMLQETMEDLFEAEDVQRLWEATAHEVQAATDQESAKDRNMLAQMRKMIQAKNKPVETAESQRSSNSPELEDPISEESRPLVFKFRRILRELAASSKWDALTNRSECLNAMAIEAATMNEDHAACRECGVIYTETRPASGMKELGEVDVNDNSQEGPQKVSRRRRSAEEDMKWLEFEGSILPSAKTAALVAQIEEWVKEDPKSKIIVFTQFQMMRAILHVHLRISLTLYRIKIIGRMCTQRGWDHCSYHGKMSHEARDKAIRNFRDMEEKKLLIASLKCGGVGLNLTMASRVICIDLWWNTAVEQQAFCRVFRIGQIQETHITRFVVKNTVDEKLQNMQIDKQADIDSAMGDDGTRQAKLSLSELIRLFGPVHKDGTHKEFIIVDDEHEFETEVPELPDD
ncbi:hypothetical protein MMC11_005745 [Xylographa trunciseda]|nr:hypothetical protein [Xylographa trunciseda]